MKNCKLVLFSVICTYKTEKKSSKTTVNYNGNTEESQNLYFLTYKFPSKNQCQFKSNLENIPIYIDADQSVNIYLGESIKLNKINNNDNYNYEISVDNLNSLEPGTHFIYLAEGQKVEKQKMSNMKIEIYDDYSVDEIDDSELNEGKISELTITFNNNLNSVPNNFLLIKNSNKEIYSNNCNLSNGKEVKCSFDLSSIIKGTYKLSYLNQCGKYTELPNDITIKENLSLNLIHPSYVYLEKVDYYTNFKFIFSRDFENDNKPKEIEFIKGDYKLLFNKFKIESNTIIVNFIPSKYTDLPLGEYKVNIKLTNGTILSNSNTIRILTLPSLIETSLTIVKTYDEIKKIPVIFEDSVEENPISRIVFEDKTNLEFKIHPSDDKIISINTTSITLTEGKHNFYIYTNANMMVYQINIIESSEIIPNHNVITHSKNGEAYLILSVPESISNIYYRSDIMKTEKELNPFWIGSNIYIYKTKELDESLEISYKNEDSDEIKKFENKFYVISDILNFVNLEVPSCIPSKCGYDYLLIENPSNKKYCFDDFEIPIKNYNEDLMESLDVILLSPNGEEIDLEYDDYYGGFYEIDVDEDEREKINGVGNLYIIRNDDDKILYSKEIIFTSFQLTSYSQYSGLVTENNLWFKFKSQCFPDIFKIYYEEDDDDEEEFYISFNCSLENENEYKCDLGNKKLKKVKFNLGYDGDVKDIYINFYTNIKEPYIDYYYKNNDFYKIVFYPNLLLNKGLSIKKIILKNKDDEIIEVNEYYTLENKNYMIVYKEENFIEYISINIFNEEIIKSYYISQLIFSDDTTKIYDAEELLIKNKDQLIIKFEDGSYRKNIFFKNSYNILSEKFIIIEEGESYENEYINFNSLRKYYYNDYYMEFTCNKEGENILNCNRRSYYSNTPNSLPFLSVYNQLSYNFIKVVILQNGFYSNEEGNLVLILYSEGNILNEEFVIKLINKDNLDIVQLIQGTSEKKGEYYTIEYSIPFNQITNEKI